MEAYIGGPRVSEPYFGAIANPGNKRHILFRDKYSYNGDREPNKRYLSTVLLELKALRTQMTQDDSSNLRLDSGRERVEAVEALGNLLSNLLHLQRAAVQPSNALVEGEPWDQMNRSIGGHIPLYYKSLNHKALLQ